MKKIVTTLLTLFLVTAALAGGMVKDNLVCKSAILKMDRLYSIYLPEGYDTSARSYPVLYLLHGAGGNQSNWIRNGQVEHIADQAIADGRATPMIIVMPDAGGPNQGYFNSVKGEWNYEDFFFKELIPHIEKTYRCMSDRSSRAIAGLSMGGGGTLYYALHHPELFSSACPLSAYMSMDEGPVRERFATYLKDVDPAKVDQFLAYHNVLTIVDKADEAELKKISSVRWYVDCGDDDFLYLDSSRFHVLFRQKNIPHEYRVRDGGHTWKYWRESLPDVLEFVSVPFQNA